ncbi:MAG TPA: hypothetical protein VIA18_02450, partial [Polyangia bacterium]|nr:hypothetical protein [Polyangia bacterium]
AVSCAAIVPYLGVRRLAVGAWIGGYGSAAHLNHDPRFISHNVCAYLVHILGFGVSLHGFGAWPALIRISTFALALVFVVVLAFCLVDRARHRAFSGFTLSFLAVAFFVTILPSINLAVDANGSEGERYLYLSSAWFAILVAALLRPAGERPWRIAALVALLAACATALIARNHDWQRASRLCRNVLDDLHAAPPRDALYVLDMPDDIHDAYVFRNAIWDALALVYPDATLPPIYVVSVRRLLAPAHPAAHIVRAGDDITLTLADGGDGLEYWNPPAPDAYSLVAHTPQAFTARIHSRGNIGYYQFANGHLQPLNE